MEIKELVIIVHTKNHIEPLLDFLNNTNVRYKLFSPYLKVKNREYNTNVLNHIPINRSLSITGKPYCNNATITTVL